MENRIVISGMGITSAAGLGLKDFHDKIKNAPTDLSVKTEWEEEELSSSFSYALPDFKIKQYYTNLRPPFPLRYSKIAMMGCLDAYQNADIENLDIDPGRIGLILNSTFGANAASEVYLTKLYSRGPRRVSPFKFTKTVSNSALGDISRYFKLRGVSSFLQGENSICYGFDLLKENKADIVLCGGFDEVRDNIYLLYNEKGFLLPSHSDVEETPLNIMNSQLQKHRNDKKVIFGEGAAFLVLERLENALKRKAKIYAEVVNYASITDLNYSNYIFERSADSYFHAMKICLENANAKPEEIDTVVGAACLPWQFEEYEKGAFENLFGSNGINYTTIKPFIGETFGSSGQASAIGAILMLNDKQLYDKGLETHLFNSYKNHSKEPDQVIVNSIHSGGNTTSVLLRKFEV